MNLLNGTQPKAVGKVEFIVFEDGNLQAGTSMPALQTMDTIGRGQAALAQRFAQQEALKVKPVSDELILPRIA